MGIDLGKTDMEHNISTEAIGQVYKARKVISSCVAFFLLFFLQYSSIGVVSYLVNIPFVCVLYGFLLHFIQQLLFFIRYM